MKYAELDEHIGDVTEYLGWLKANRHKLVALPSRPNLTSWDGVYEYEFATDDEGNRLNHRDYGKVDEFETRRLMRKIVKSIGSCDKNHSGGTFTVTKRFGKTVRIQFATRRDAVCRKVVKEVKRVPKRQFVDIPGEFTEEEVVEWECSDSLLASN